MPAPAFKRLRFSAKFLLGAFAAALVLSALILATGWFFRPDLAHRPPMPSALAAEVAQRARDPHPDTAHPPVIWREVDYAEGSRAAWWPKAESPILDDLVRAGQLPPLAERIGPEPLVLEGVDGLGHYGGTWNRLATNPGDLEGILPTRLSYVSLVRWSPQGYPIVPHLAKSWTSSPDKRVWTFTLRRGLRWSDGVPFTTDDILFWWNYEVLYFNSDAVTDASFMRHAGRLGRIEKIDDLTLRFSFDTPNTLFLEKLASAFDYFRPVHYLKKYHPAIGDQKLIAETMRTMNLPSPYSVYIRLQSKLNPEHPRLWPWIYCEYKTSAPQTLVRNPYYFAVDPAGNQLPYLDRVLIDIKNKSLISASAAAGDLALQERHIDFEDYTLLASEAASHGYRLLHWYSGTRTMLQLSPNLNRAIDPHDPATAWKHRLLNTVDFRRALSLAINRREIITAVYNGVGVPAQTSPGPDSLFRDDRQFHSYTAYDPARANALLDSIGLTHRDREGFRTFPDGTRMTWMLNVAESFPPDAPYLIADQWARVGVRAIVQITVRTLWQVQQAALEHDFTVWPGLEEFMPMLDPRSFVAINGATFFAPTWGRWYQRGGLHDTPASHAAGLSGPPPGHPARRAMELYDLAQSAPDAATMRGYFHQILEIAADNLWSIGIATPPPALAVVKDGFRNVPDNLVAGYFFMTPANAGLETFFWDHPHDSPAAIAQMQQSLITPSRLPMLASADAAESGPRLAHWLGAALSLALLAGFIWIAWHHAFVWRRVLTLIPTLAAISVIIFFIVQAPPGDFITSKSMELSLNGDPSAGAQLEDLRKTFRFDEPPLQQYADWMGFKWFVTFRPADAGLLQGNLGRSMASNLPVNEILGDRLALTFVISFLTILVTWFIALPIGIYSAVKPYTLGDYFLTLIGFVGMSVPPFLLALVLMYASGEYFGVNVSGLFSVRYAADPAWSWGKFVDLLQHVWVPVIVLGVGSTAVMIRVMRANLLDELKKPYVVAARAKGVRPLKLLLKYPVRIALNPFVSGIASLFPQLVSGGAIVALVLSLPTIGPMLMMALLNEDTYFAASMLMLLSVLGAFGTLVSDLLLLWLDPRIRFTGGRK
ncbi:ABC transporter permease subunit [Horticoccus luteus]|uniref:ABC transporter permease subunit n=1 Tax=Horticoccus luteus TaxID=2862869 RepID=A0A8F9XLE6_9BACT|nr:ABC transporter substrate-binding protein [Horticoccus luteus]QYM79136.1 ABC transporter permease subunit [Horticoccus luteus]